MRLPHSIFIALTLVLLSAGAAARSVQAQTCPSVTFDRVQARAVGTCLASGKPCSGDSQCSEHSRDYCVHGVSASDSSARCYGGNDCLDEITFHFDREYECGQFLNGDWWLKAENGRVGIERITPDHLPGCESGGACRHGWEIASEVWDRQGLSSFADVYQARTQSLPAEIAVTDTPVSIMKGIDNRMESGCDRDNCFLFAAVLTVVPVAPPPNAFRPAYAGPDARGADYYTHCDIRYELLPSLPMEQALIGLDIEDVSAFLSTPFLGQNGRNNQRRGNMTLTQGFLASASTAGSVNGYHAARAQRLGDAVLRLMLSDFDPMTQPEHRLALVRLIQVGIDYSGIVRNWHESDRIKATASAIAIAAFLLGDPELAATGFVGFSEEDTVLDTPRASSGTGDVIWGYRGTEATYWRLVTTGDGDRWLGDPYGFVDSAAPYQNCCSSGSWRGEALALDLLRVPDTIGDIDLGPYRRYMRRWWEHGYHTAPDPCASPPPDAAGCVPPNCPGYGTTWGPAPGNGANCHLTGTCECIGHGGDPMHDGRNPGLHGTEAGSGGWASSYSASFAEAFYPCAASCCEGMVCEPSEHLCHAVTEVIFADDFELE